MHDFRPISCCNVIYKCITKIIVARIKPALDSVISKEQTAFLPGRQISDAILLSQELLHNYHTNSGVARCAIKIDIKKAFDTVSWTYIIASLTAIGIPALMISWIHKCISTAHFTVSLNGGTHGYFRASRGLRQGDPLSPYLFVLAMEGFHGIMQKAVQLPQFKYHWRCAKNNITHVCFADDLLVFCHGNRDTVGVIRQALEEFSDHSGLQINLAKSAMYLTGITRAEKEDIERAGGIKLSRLPVKYLGVPLITTRLRNADCASLVEKITTKIHLWTSATLTYAGRLQLIQSVLFSYQVFWSGIFILPGATIKKIESIMVAFLWKGSGQHARAKVVWSDLCYPKEEGGLGLKRLKIWNRAATLRHIWHLLTKRTSIWVDWTNTNLLKDRSLWEIKIPSRPSWSWRKILQSRDWCRGDFQAQLGNGNRTFMWHDYWLPGSARISDSIDPRILRRTSIGWNAKVSEAINNGHWMFPRNDRRRGHIWANIPPPLLSLAESEEDWHPWKHHASGVFTVESAWEKLRDRKAINHLHGLLWYKGYLPRHSFILWLATQNRLHTLDRLARMGITIDKNCKLCNSVEETHCHLFFQCTYSKSVLDTALAQGQIQWPQMQWSQFLLWASTAFEGNGTANNHIAKTILAVTMYYLWIERNERTFKRVHRSPQVLGNVIIQLIRAHLMNIDIEDLVNDRTRATWNL